MALSPNYGWSEPDNSSLVKNGAADIRTLGDAIDTSLWNVGFGQAGKNKIINGDFGINQRNFTSTTTYDFGFDRFINAVGGGTGTVTFTAQTFTPGTAPVAGYEGKNYLRCVTTGQSAAGTYTIIQQAIEDVRTFAGQTATISFWAKAASGTPKMFVEFEQGFGSGGSASVTTGSQVTISTSWARYSVTLNVPSVAGKTIGANNSIAMLLWTSAGSTFNTRTSSLGIQSNTFEVWGVQAEYGSKATPFQTATGTIQGELAACQRYYFRMTPGSAYGPLGIGLATSTTVAEVDVTNPVPMRVPPTAVEYANIALHLPGVVIKTFTALVLGYTGYTNQTVTTSGSTGLTTSQTYKLTNNNNSSAYIAFSAEL